MLKELIKIKGTRNGLVFYFNTKEASFEELKTALVEKFESSNGFFNNAGFIISHDSRFNTEETKILENICIRFGMVKSSFEISPVEISADCGMKQPEAEDHTEYFRAESDAVLINKNLRSGQKVYVRGHAVILGDVNPGAQVAATGSIIVMGCLRGIAHAGAHGDDTAYIMAFRMQPSQIRIADKLCRAPESSFAVNYPELAVIVDNYIVVKPYHSSKRKVANL